MAITEEEVQTKIDSGELNADGSMPSEPLAVKEPTMAPALPKGVSQPRLLDRADTPDTGLSAVLSSGVATAVATINPIVAGAKAIDSAVDFVQDRAQPELYESQLTTPTTPYSAMAKTEGEVKADSFYSPIAVEAIKKGYTEAEIEAKIGVQQWKTDKAITRKYDEAAISDIQTRNMEVNNHIIPSSLEADKDKKLRAEKTSAELAVEGFEFDPETNLLVRDGQQYDQESTFADVVKAHGLEVAGSIVGSIVGGRVGGTTGAFVGGGVGAGIGNVGDNVRMKALDPYKSVTDEEEQLLSVLDYTYHGAIAGVEDVAGGAVVAVLGKTVAKGWGKLSQYTKATIQDLRSNNINPAYDRVISKSTETEEALVRDTTDYLRHMDGGQEIIAEGVDSVKFKQQVILRQLFHSPDFKANLNGFLADSEAVQTTTGLIRNRSDALKEAVGGSGLESKIYDPAGGFASKEALDNNLQATLDVLDMTRAQVSDATKLVNIDGQAGLQLQGDMNVAVDELEKRVLEIVKLGGQDTRTASLLSDVKSKLGNIVDMDSLLSFRASYNELLTQMNIYGKNPYGKTMQGSTVQSKAKVDRDIALDVKEQIDEFIKGAIDSAPMDTATKATLKKNFDDGNTLARTVYETRSTKLYKAISNPDADSYKIVDNIFSKMGAQSGDYASIVSHLKPEQRVGFDQNLIQRQIEQATTGDGLIDFIALKNNLAKLDGVTPNAETRASVALVNKYAELFGDTISVFTKTTNQIDPAGLSRGIETTVAGVLKRTLIGVMKEGFQTKYLGIRNAVAKIPGVTTASKIVGAVPGIGSGLKSVDKTITEHASTQAIYINALKAMGEAKTVSQFVEIAEKAKVLPTKLISEVRSLANLVAKSVDENQPKVDGGNAIGEVILAQKKRAREAEYARQSEYARASQNAGQMDVPTPLEQKINMDARHEKEFEQAKEARAKDVGATDVEAMPTTKQIPDNTSIIEAGVDGKVSAVRGSGEDASLSADRPLNTNMRTADQAILDETVTPRGTTIPTEVHAEQAQLPAPEGGIVTPQTIDDAIARSEQRELDRVAQSRDYEPDEAWDMLYKAELTAPKSSSFTKAGLTDTGGSDYKVKQVRQAVAKNFKKFANAIEKRKGVPAMKSANRSLVTELTKPNPDPTVVKKAYARVRKEAKASNYKVPTLASLTKGGRPYKMINKADRMPKQLQDNLYTVDALEAAETLLASQSKSPTSRTAGGFNQGSRTSNPDYVRGTTTTNEAHEINLTKAQVKRIRNGEGTADDYADLELDVQRLERDSEMSYQAEGDDMFGGLTPADIEDMKNDPEFSSGTVREGESAAQSLLRQHVQDQGAVDQGKLNTLIAQATPDVTASVETPLYRGLNLSQAEISTILDSKTFTTRKVESFTLNAGTAKGANILSAGNGTRPVTIKVVEGQAVGINEGNQFGFASGVEPEALVPKGTEYEVIGTKDINGAVEITVKQRN